MGDKTGIEWTDATWNPIRGCSRVGPECDRCYAMLQARRFDFDARPETTDDEGNLIPARSAGPYFGLTRTGPNGPDWSGKVEFVPDHLLDPVRWARPRRIFVASMSDPFHPAVPRDWQDEINAVIAFTPRHTYQQLTKRADRQRAYYADPETPARIMAAAERLGGLTEGRTYFPVGWPLSNLIVGTSIGVVDAAPRAFDLAATPARRRFISFEPLLEDVADAVEPALAMVEQREKFQAIGPPLIGWGIIGGESQRGARPFDVWAARRLLNLFAKYGIAPFVKQLGANPQDVFMNNPAATPEEAARWMRLGWTRISGGPSGEHWRRYYKLKDPAGGDMAEWPEDLRLREFPA